MQTRETTARPGLEWQEAVWLLIVLSVPLFVNLWVDQLFEASKVWLLRTLVWTLVVLWLGGWLLGSRPKPLPPAVLNLTVALVLVLLLSTYLSAYRYIAIFGTLERAAGVLTQISYLLLFICIATQIDAERSRRLLYAIILTAVPICLLGLAQAAGWRPLPAYSDARSPLMTTLGRANFTGAYLALLVPLTLTAAQSAAVAWRRAAFAALTALEVAVIALAQARAAWVALAAGLGVLLWLRLMPRWSRRVRRLTALGGAVVLAGGLYLLFQRGLSGGGSIAARWTIWQAALRLLRPKLWFGYGADTLELYFPAVYPPQLVYYQGRGVVVDRAHNWLLDWSLNYGVVATAILIGLILVVLWKGVRRLVSPDGDGTAPAGDLEQRWLAACIAAISMHLIGNLFLFEVAATALVFWVLLGIVTAATANTPAALSPPAGKLVTALVIALSVAFLGWAVWHSSVRPLLADMHSWRGTRALNRENVPAALAEYSQAVERQPQRAAYRVAAALTAAQLGDFAQAEESMRQAIRLRPADPVLHTQLAAVYAHEARETPGRIRSAYAAYERAIALAPAIALTYQQYADLALRSGDAALAAAQAQKAVDLDATDGVSFGILGWVHLQDGNPGAAQRAFEQAVKWAPDSADFHLGLATAHFRQGNFDAARRALQRSLQIDPGYGPSLTLQVELARQ